MKPLIMTLSFMLSLYGSSFAQLKLSAEEMATVKDAFLVYNGEKKESSLTTAPTRFQPFIAQLLASKANNDTMPAEDYFRKPSKDQLLLWYAIRELHYHKSADASSNLTQEQILHQLSNTVIDDRWLLDNYYYRIQSRISMLFNTADLSQHNFQLADLGLNTPVEQAIFVYFITKACGQRLSVMRFTGKGNPKATLDRFPKINGRDYYYFTNFEYPDFEWVGYQKKESYNERHLNSFYELLLNHIEIEISAGEIDKAKQIYRNSILSKPDLFKYSKSEKALVDLHKKWQ